MPRKTPFSLNIQGTLLAGILTIAPLAAVWLVFNFLLGILSAAGRPLVDPIAQLAHARSRAGFAPQTASATACPKPRTERKVGVGSITGQSLP